MPVPDCVWLTEEIEKALRALEGHIDQTVAAWGKEGVMNPYIVMDAQRVVQDHFGLVLAASARGHALKAGAQPLVDDAECAPAELAMKEIASRAISEDDMTIFLSATKPRRLSLMRPNRDLLEA